jgi:hypothetical protein
MTTKSMTTQQEEQLQSLIDKAEVAYARNQTVRLEAAEERIFAYVNGLLAEKDAQIAELRTRLSQADEDLEQIERDERAFAEMNEGWEKAEAERDEEDDYIDPDDVSPDLHDFLTDQSIDPATLTHKRLQIAERLMRREQRRHERAEGEG